LLFSGTKITDVSSLPRQTYSEQGWSLCRFASWISGRIVSLQPDTDTQNLLWNGNRIRIRISETLFSTFRVFTHLEKFAHRTIIHLVFSEGSFQRSVPWLQVCVWC